MSISIEYADAGERHRKAPETFAPTTGDDLADIKPGDCVKVCVTAFDGQPAGERFWVEVTEVVGGRVMGKVSNHLTHVPLPVGAVIEFGKGNIFEVYQEPAADV